MFGKSVSHAESPGPTQTRIGGGLVWADKPCVRWESHWCLVANTIEQSSRTEMP